ncbi:MAG: carboxypeptidase M32 [Anaerolineae bacterium]|nr:carboxypeptidase M32 [Anaerolineae bacterium]
MTLAALKARLTDIYLLNRANAVLSWDQQTQMPPGGAAARAEQLAVLGKLAHQMLVAGETGELLAAAEAETTGMGAEQDDAAYVRVAREVYDDATKLPESWVVEFNRTTAQAHHIWAKAREEKDFQQFLPTLERIFDLVRQQADYLGYAEKPYDALLDKFERGTTSAEVAAIFGQLRTALVPIVHAIQANQDRVSDAPLHGQFPSAQQRAFGEFVVKQFGFNFENGRQDVAVHPFCTSFSPRDVRITTRFDETWLSPALFGTMHESGHGLYEQGIPLHWENDILGNAVSLAFHESQSRLWENVVGRSRAFWGHFYPRLQATFPQQFENVDVEAFYRAVNQVKPSFIRVEADEVTYALHIMLRFDLEQAVINDGFPVKELPDAWNAKMQEYLGITPPDDGLGVLQDIHWSLGIMGYFSTYALGNMLAVQLYDLATAQHPSIPAEIAEGQFETLLGWMRSNIHQHGSKYRPKALLKRVTGADQIDPAPFLRYIQHKYGEIYAL